jgi:Tol biopolymer transport system component
LRFAVWQPTFPYIFRIFPKSQLTTLLMKKIFLLLVLPICVFAQNIPLVSFKKYPFPTELCATGVGSKLTWALDEQGKRNVYVAEGPDYNPRKLTSYTRDDGQEISSVSISGDGNSVVFVRGGDHGSNWDDQAAVNPMADPFPSDIKIVSIPFKGGVEKTFSDGDYPVISPDSKRVTFIKAGQVWSAPIDSIQTAKSLFKTRGTVHSLEWNPDGSSLLFVSDRGDHSLIGVYTDATTPLQWIAPSFSVDVSPRWSPDGKKIVFVRMPGTGGSPDSLLNRRHRPWSIYTADVTTRTVRRLWEAPRTLKGSVPNTHGGFNLHWAAGNKIVFLSYQDGWPHLYSMDTSGGKPLLLTPGNFICEHIALSADKKSVTFSANTGPDKLDLERRHAAIVSVDKSDMRVLSPGSGLEWTPVLTES